MSWTQDSEGQVRETDTQSVHMYAVFHTRSRYLGHRLVVPDSKVHGANMGSTWVLSSPGGPQVGPMKLAIWGYIPQNTVECNYLSMSYTPAYNNKHLKYKYDH